MKSALAVTFHEHRKPEWTGSASCGARFPTPPASPLGLRYVARSLQEEGTGDKSLIAKSARQEAFPCP